MMYANNDDVARQAFKQLEAIDQKMVCSHLQQKKPFLVRNEQEKREQQIRTKDFKQWQRMRSPNAIFMVHLESEPETVIVFKGEQRFQVLLHAFTSLCGSIREQA